MVTTKNEGENLILALEKMLKDNGDSISAEDKEKLEKAIEQAKKDFETDNIDELRSAIDRLSKENEGIVTKLYQAAAEKYKAEHPEENKPQGDDEVIIDDNK